MVFRNVWLRFVLFGQQIAVYKPLVNLLNGDDVVYVLVPGFAFLIAEGKGELENASTVLDYSLRSG